MKSLEIEDL